MPPSVPIEMVPVIRSRDRRGGFALVEVMIALLMIAFIAGDSQAGNTPRKRRGLQTVEDVSDIEGVRPEEMRLLRRRLTIYNSDGRLDIKTTTMSAFAKGLSSSP